MPECANFNWTVKEFKKVKFKPGTNGNNSLAIWLEIVSAIVILAVMVILFVICCRKRKGYKGIEGTKKALPDQDLLIDLDSYYY